MCTLKKKKINLQYHSLTKKKKKKKTQKVLFAEILKVKNGTRA